MESVDELAPEDRDCLVGVGNHPNTNHPTSYAGPLTALGSLYFIFGFITCLNDILVPHLKAVFELNYARAMLIQFSFFSAYFIMSLPSGWLVDRVGYQRGMVSGLVTMAAGCLLFYPAAESQAYAMFLAALFLLAAGVTLLQVAANPYVAVLGRPETASSRLTLTQGFNSLGTTLAPLFGSVLILAGGGAASVQLPYLGLAATLVALAGFTAWYPMPVAGPDPGAPDDPAAGVPHGPSSPWRHRPMLLGTLGIFLYVGAEVGIGSFLVNYINQPSVGGIPLAHAARYVSLYWGGAMVGRFVGAGVMRLVPPPRVLTCNALAALALVLTAMAAQGRASMWALLAVGFFNSIMFPTIFTLAIKDLGRHMGQASGILCLAVVGGAVVPLAQGLLADWQGIRTGFVLPAICYAYIAFFGAAGYLPRAGKGSL
ncbi:MAG: sugar MFS transporter [Holophaga sp.]|nr:sugar MFS transporter [Holophaga sp.]